MSKQGRGVSLNYRIDCVDKKLTLLVRLPRRWICLQHLIVHCNATEMFWKSKVKQPDDVTVQLL